MTFNPKSFIAPRGIQIDFPYPALPFVTPEMYGAIGDGATNDAAAFNAALVAGASVGAPVLALGAKYKINSTLSWDQSKTSLMAYGAVLDFSSLGASTALAPFTTWPDPNDMAGVHNTRPIGGFRMFGPSVNTSNPSIAIAPVPSTISGLPWFTGCIFQNIGVRGFDVFYDIPGGSVCPVFRSITFGSIVGTDSGWFMRSMGALNGEKIGVVDCFVVNCTGFYLSTVNNVNLDIDVMNTSLDGLTFIATSGTLTAPGTGGITEQFKFIGGHWEPARYTDYLIWTAATGNVTAFGVQQIGAVTIAHVPFKSDSTNLNGGIRLHGHNLNTTDWPGGIICDGTGNFFLESSGVANTVYVNSSKATNRVPSYTFPNSGSLTSNWTGTPVYDSVEIPPDTDAVGSADISAGNLTSFSTTCNPGQTLGGQLMIKFVNPGGGDQFVISVYYADKGGNLLATQQVALTDEIADWTLWQSSFDRVAPPGAATAEIAVRYVASGGGADAWFALPQVIIN